MKQVGKYTIFFSHSGGCTGIRVDGQPLPRFMLPELCSALARREFDALDERGITAYLRRIAEWYAGEAQRVMAVLG